MIQKENYKIYNGDCLEIMEQLSDGGIKFDLVLSDPPPTVW